MSVIKLTQSCALIAYIDSNPVNKTLQVYKVKFWARICWSYCVCANVFLIL